MSEQPKDPIERLRYWTLNTRIGTQSERGRFEEQHIADMYLIESAAEVLSAVREVRNLTRSVQQLLWDALLWHSRISDCPVSWVPDRRPADDPIADSVGCAVNCVRHAANLASNRPESTVSLLLTELDRLIYQSSGPLAKQAEIMLMWLGHEDTPNTTHRDLGSG